MQFPIDTLGDAAVPHNTSGSYCILQFLSERLFEDQENTKQQETPPQKRFKKHLKTLRRDFI